jgi:hypothetical protein
MNLKSDFDCSVAQFRKTKYVADYKSASDCTMVDFKGFSYTVEKSDLTGGDWHKYSKTPETFRLEYFNKQIPTVSVDLPEAYIIPAAWTEIIDALKLHGVKMKTLKDSTNIKVRMYQFSDVTFNSATYEGHLQPDKFSVNTITVNRHFPAGSAVIDMNQRTARIIAQALEPQCKSSFFKWGYFNSIFEQKEYSETYVMEGVAREMMKENPALKEEFEKRKAAGEFHDNQWLMLNWFYVRSKYRDSEMNLYPVGMITDRTEIEKLIYDEK